MRILVVEDEHRIAQSLQKGLTQERYVVDIAYDGESGYDLATTEHYDIIVLDVMLPKMDGYRFSANLRKSSIHTPILMLTAKGQIHEKVNGFDVGADDYLTKPFAFEELLARIKALLRRPQTVVQETLTVDNLTLDTKTFEVRRGKTPILLSHKEFVLLEYLMRNARTIMSKDNIIAHVWDYDADILPNTVEVYIKNLRSKIDGPFKKAKPLINTVRGFGYKIGS